MHLQEPIDHNGIHIATTRHAIRGGHCAAIERSKLVFSPEEAFATTEQRRAVMTRASA